MGVLCENTIIGASGAGGYTIDQSLRFNDDDSAYLSRTFSSGNRKTWTFSCWMKRNAKLASAEVLFGTGQPNTGTSFGGMYFESNGKLYIYDPGNGCAKKTVATLRDPSAWYHVMGVMDATNTVARIYINGEEVTEWTSGEDVNPSNSDGNCNASGVHTIGMSASDSTLFLDGYLAEVNFIDGQALSPSDFGETGDYGEWKPIKYTGTYGTNGFYLPFKQDYQVEGFSTVTYTGNGSTQYIGGTGFQPDLVWVKNRNSTQNHFIMNTVTPNEFIIANMTNSADTNAGYHLTHNPDGFTQQDSAIAMNTNGNTYVAWSWDMGGSNATNTDGSITSTVRANTTYGQSIVSYNGSGSNATIGHGLSSAPEMIIVKNRDAADRWQVYHNNVTNMATGFMSLNESWAFSTASSAIWNSTSPTNSVFSIGTDSGTNTNNQDYIAYCFHSVAGYSKFGSYTGDGTTDQPVTTGFEPAFVMVKKTNAVGDWTMHDNTRGGDNRIYANEFDVEGTGYAIGFTSTGFTLGCGCGNWNNNGDTYIYMAFADTREYAYWLDQSGNNNDWTSNNLTESDVSLDSPTNNFCTLNPLTPPRGTEFFTEGNLEWANTSGTVSTARPSNLAISINDTNKYYNEFYLNSMGNTGDLAIGLGEANGKLGRGVAGSPASDIGLYSYRVYHGEYYNNCDWCTADSGHTTVTTTGKIVMIAFDAGTRKVWFGVDGVWNEGNPETGTSPSMTISENYDLVFYVGGYNGPSWVANFGQDSSFAGNKTAQGNTDDNGYGDFYYEPPTGYLALCTQNLPDPAVIPSEHFNTVLYTGDGTSSHAITGVGFQPDWVWAKSRSVTEFHYLWDKVRGENKSLYSDITDAEATDNKLTSFDSDGFTINAAGHTNSNGQTYVAWNWKANGSGVSNTDGSITSTVSANTDAGFSIVKYVGTGNADLRVGHGLSVAPEMIILKSRDRAENWFVYHEATGTGREIFLNNTTADASNGNAMTVVNSSYFESDGDTPNRSGDNFIAYCFHSVDGYSKVGSYTGNGSSDGTFVYTGFRPAYVLIKRTNSSGQGAPIFDSARDTYNTTVKRLNSNSSTSELTTDGNIDFLSNGFKARNTDGQVNTNGGDYIYIAFAETPFKYTNAR